MKLNLKNLYQANGFAVKELLKVAALLHQALDAAAAAAFPANTTVSRGEQQRLLARIGADEAASHVAPTTEALGIGKRVEACTDGGSDVSTVLV